MTRRLLFRIPVAVLLSVVLGACSQTASSTVPTTNAAASNLRSNASVAANVTVRNRTYKYWIRTYVDWAYDYAPWFNESGSCLAPGTRWDTKITYNRPTAGPQIRIRTWASGADCQGRISETTRDVAYKEMKFKNDAVDVNAERRDDELCVTLSTESTTKCAQH